MSGRRLAGFTALLLTCLISATGAQSRRSPLADAAQAGSALTTAQARHQALVQLCLALFNANEFVYPD